MDINAGAPGATWQLAQALRGLGHDVDILSFDDMSGSASTKRFRFPWFMARRIMRRPAYDVYDLSSGDGWVASLARAGMPRRAGSIIVARSHGLEQVMHDALVAETKSSGHALSWKYPIYNGGFRLWECRQSFARADLALFLNTFDQDYAVERLGVARERTARVINGTSDAFIAHARTLAAPPDAGRPTNVAFIGNHIERKGIRFLRDAMVQVMRRHDDVHLAFFGTGASPETVRSAYPDDLRARIAVTPRYVNLELPALLEGMHILAFPSLSEGFGLVIIEAMACGLVPVVSDIPGPTGIIADGRDGLVVARADAEALRAAIERLLVEPRLWHRLRRAAIAGVAAYDWRTVAADTVALYAAALAR